MKDFVKNVFFVLTASFTTVFILIFMMAYSNGGTVLVDINYFGEMWFEAGIIMFYLLLLIPRTMIFFKK